MTGKFVMYQNEVARLLDDVGKRSLPSKCEERLMAVYFEQGYSATDCACEVARRQ